MSKKLFLLDAYALIYRSYYAFIKNPRYNSKGLNTSAIYGFLNTLMEVLTKEDPNYIAVVFDPSTPTFRHDKYEAYKANREAMPEDIRNAIPYIKQLIDGFNIKQLHVDGYEADDVIGTLAKKAAKEDFETYMMTPDKDYMQLIDDNIFMYKPKRSGNSAEVIDKTKACEKYDLDKPEQFIDILALWGDSSDNIPGAPGIGEKTATKLIRQYGSVDGIYEHINELKGKQKENLIEYKDQVYLSRELVTICLDVPIDLQLNTLERDDPNEQVLTPLLEELEFRTIAQRLFQKELMGTESPLQGSLFGDEQVESQSAKSIDAIEHDYRLVNSDKEIAALIDDLQKQPAFCFDTETTSLNPHTCELVGIAFSYKATKGWYVPFPKDQKATKKLLDKFNPVLSNEQIEKVGQNLKFDIMVLTHYGIQVKGPLFDTMIAHYLLQPELQHNMDYLAETYLHYKPESIEELIGKKGKNQLSMRNIPEDRVKEYACEDADITWQLMKLLREQLKKANLLDLAETLEFPLIYVLANMEVNGVKLSTDSLSEYTKDLQQELDKTEKEIHDLAGETFNVGSPKQLGEILFDKLKLDSKAKKTKSKQYSTSEETLQKISDKHPIIEKVLEFRSIKKLLNTYVEALPKLINEETGKLHTSFNQAVTSTGRLSSNNPNLQNIPIREERGKAIRRAFVPSDNEHILVAADYSQIELRLMAHMSQDDHMVEAFKQNEDIHAATAAKIFHVENPKNVTSEQRRKAKTANFGIIYGISAFGLSQRLNIPRKEAKEIIDEYFEGFPKVKEYMDRSIKEGRDKGFVQTMLKRKRYLKDINSRNGVVRGLAERNAINAPIQGSAADIIKLAMIDIFKALEDQSWKTRMILQVHDELIFDTPKEEVEALKKMVREKMENAVKISVPLTVDIGEGDNWLQAH
ncbi:MAG: DNA polymerase I [Bacteroidales bacterium]